MGMVGPTRISRPPLLNARVNSVNASVKYRLPLFIALFHQFPVLALRASSLIMSASLGRRKPWSNPSSTASSIASTSVVKQFTSVYACTVKRTKARHTVSVASLWTV